MSTCSSIQEDPLTPQVSGMKDPNSTGARRVMRSSERLTRTVAFVMLGLGKDERRPCRVKGSSCNEGTDRC